MARILIVGGGCRGRRFAERMVEQGHAVRASTRAEAGRAAIEATGAECWIGTPDRLATLRGALENVTVACWMLACARGSQDELDALHSSRLEFFLSQAIDTTARGLIYDAWPVGEAESRIDARTGDSAPATSAPLRPSAELLARGAEVFRSLTELNAIPAVVLGQELGRERAPEEGQEDHDELWLAEAAGAVQTLLGGAR